MNSKIVNIMGLIASIAVFFILASSLVKSISRIKLGDSVVEKTKVKIEKSEAENQKLAEQLKITQSNEFLEKQLRDKMGLAKEGEIILVLPEADIVRKLAPQISEEEEIKPKTNLEKWMELFK
jgi:cell division protein FtsB